VMHAVAASGRQTIASAKAGAMMLGLMVAACRIQTGSLTVESVSPPS
jgi:hypothetical protein